MSRQTMLSLFFALSLGSTLAAPRALAQGGCCVEFDNGGGTATMPPNCSYFGLMRIENGLPAGTTIDIDADLGGFFGIVEGPGGALGGTQSTFNGLLTMTMTGTGALGGFNRIIFMPVNGIFDFGLRNPGDPVQAFPGDVVLLTGQVFGDPDFDHISLNAGSSLGRPGPGASTLGDLGGTGTGPWNVDSFFDVEYEISFVGAPGSVLQNLGGTTVHTSRFAVCATPTSVPGAAREVPARWGEVKQLFR